MGNSVDTDLTLLIYVQIIALKVERLLEAENREAEICIMQDILDKATAYMALVDRNGGDQ